MKLNFEYSKEKDVWCLLNKGKSSVTSPHPTETYRKLVDSIGENLDDILCEQDERTVSADNCVSFEKMTLQIPADRYRCHYVRVKVMIHRYLDGSLTIFHGPRKLADYDQQGKLKEVKKAA